MNSVVRSVSIETEVTAERFSQCHAPIDGWRQRHHRRKGQGHFGHDGHLGVLAVGRPAGLDRQHQPGIFLLAAREALRLLRRQHLDIGPDRYRRAVYRQGRAEGRRSLCRRQVDDARLRRAAAGRTRWRRSTARSRISSSGIRMRSSSAAFWMLRCQHAPRRWPIGRGAMSPSIRTRMRRSLPRSACRRGTSRGSSDGGPQGIRRSCRAGFFAASDLNPANEASRNLGILRRRRARDRLSRAVRLCGFHRARPAARRSHSHFPQAGCAELLRAFNVIASVAKQSISPHNG